MTAEQAYWHACTNTPIDAAPLPRLARVERTAFNPVKNTVTIWWSDGRVEEVDERDYAAGGKGTL